VVACILFDEGGVLPFNAILPPRNECFGRYYDGCVQWDLGTMRSAHKAIINSGYIHAVFPFSNDRAKGFCNTVLTMFEMMIWCESIGYLHFIVLGV